jgi:hypothetical protein
MPSPIIEGLRQQFFASLGITENTPIAESDAANLIDQWEQYLYSRASGQGGMVVSSPTRPGTSIVLAPPVGNQPQSPQGTGNYPVATQYRPPKQAAPGGGRTVYTPPPKRS